MIQRYVGVSAMLLLAISVGCNKAEKSSSSDANNGSDAKAGMMKVVLTVPGMA